MNVIQRLTLRQLAQNKRRTAVTIIGVIISVSMITAVASLGTSFLNLLQRHTIAQNGLWHAVYENINPEQAAAVAASKQFQSVYLTQNIGYAVNPYSSNPFIPYLFLERYDRAALEHLPLSLLEGRLPIEPDELVASSVLTSGDDARYKVGDTITLEIGYRFAQSDDPQKPEARQAPLWQSNAYRLDANHVVREELRDTRKQTFTITGIADMPQFSASPGIPLVGFLDSTALTKGDAVQAFMVMDSLDSSLYDRVRALASENGIAKTTFHNELLRYYLITDADSFRSVIYGLLATIMSVIVIGSVSLIYNAFAISVADRSRYLGMLASVGATKRQKRASVFFEGAVISAISIPLGIFCGLAGIGVTLWYVNSLMGSIFQTAESLRLHVTPAALGLAVGVSLLTIFISIYFPARRASKVAAIDAIRQAQDIKLSSREVKTSRLIRTLFGLEAEIGLKNLKRNKGRYKATIFSLVISIVLFLSVGFLSDNMQKSIQMTQSGLNYDLALYNFQPGGELTLDMLRQLEGVTALTWLQTAYAYAWIPENQLSAPLKQKIEEGQLFLTEGRYNYYIGINALDDSSLAPFAAETGADLALLQDTEHPRAIVVNKVNYADGSIGKYVESEALHINAGASLALYYHQRLDSDVEGDLVVVDSTEQQLISLEAAALADHNPPGVRDLGIGSVNLIVSEAVMAKLLERRNDTAHSRIVILSDDPAATERQLVKMKGTDSLAYSNLHEERKQEKQIMLIANVFFYGFISLISLISITNILNTISTSIALRKREFAMLRSIGMTPSGFRRMINYESIFYGLKALLYGLPLSAVVMYFIHRSLMQGFTYTVDLPWDKLAIAVLAVFLIVGLSMLYASSKVRKENIIDAIKQENI